MFPILDKRLLSPTIARFVIEAPLIAKKRKPGNFVIVRVSEKGERIPLTIVDAVPQNGTITLIVQAVGKTTKLLVSKAPGDALADVVGPLGNPTPTEYHTKVACVGGGVGTAELYPIAKALRARGNSIYTVIGARTKDMLILEKEMGELSNGLYVTTGDGSYGHKGLVTDRLSALLESLLGIEAVYAIGPLSMMKAVARTTRSYGIKTIVSLNAIMVDGTGMCGGCRVTVYPQTAGVNGQIKFACVDGPEFDGHRIDFDELTMRNRTYADLERIADLSAQDQDILSQQTAISLHEGLMHELR